MSSSSSLRRPASSTSISRPPQPRSRAPSVAPPVSSAPSRRSTAVAPSQSTIRSAPSTSDDAQKKKAEAGETNIQVVVRVRGRAPNEAKKADAGILSTAGPRCQQIDVAIEPPPVSSSSILNSSSLVQDATTRQKSYHFDQVFGPEADQGMVYQDVVGPILEEVMSGYNCTIFAYGQTGTGKTFTMEGDLTSQMGTYSADAGIIPRTLYRLFHTLELSKEDYSVKANFIELYNEELRDLLSLDAPTPISEVNNAQKDQHGLRMYDDARGKGVVIQGLEEVVLKDAAHGLSVLRRGSQKRQIAATNCNEHSSRSHSVFTMTVYIKDKGSKGEDVLKIGKLNLVDLAGSENIGRSGAENKRAREAGMINQSLLTLGRVINALVEKNSHIPYRESKLTRLLQESLGGRTKTCIIATVSQDRANIEETLSTLDYALRAKSIKNRPELNTRMTRSALIKEYVFEIERLKGDLQASRNQNGIYLTEESWKTMHEEHEERKTLSESLKRNAEVTESKLTSLKEQFEQNMQLLVKRDNEVRAAKTECADKVTELEHMIAKARSLELSVEEERSLRKAYMASETRLDMAATSLAKLVEQSTNDVQGLFNKLERKTAIERSNRALVAECRNAVSQKATELESSMSAFRQAEGGFYDTLKTSLDGLTGKTESSFLETQSFLQNRLKKISNSLREVRSGQIESRDILSTLIAELEGTAQELRSVSESNLSSLKETCAAAIDDVVSANGRRFAQVSTSLDEVVESHVATLLQAQTLNVRSQEQIAQAKLAAEAAAADELSRLRAQNALLSGTVEEMKQSSNSMKTDLIQNISQLINGFADAQDRQLTMSIAKAQEQVTDSVTATQAHASAQAERFNRLGSAAETVTGQLTDSSAKIREQTQGISNAIEQGTQELGSKLGDFVSAIEHDLDTGAESAIRSYELVSQLALKGREEVESRTKSQSTKIKTLNAKVSETFETMEKNLQTSYQEMMALSHEAGNHVERHQAEASTFDEQAIAHLNALRSDSNSFLATKFKDDVSTGQTPQKRSWKMPSPWRLVPSDRAEAVEMGRNLPDISDTEHQTDVASDNMVPSSEPMYSELSPSSDDAEPEMDTVAATPIVASPQVKVASPSAEDAALEDPRRTDRTRALRELPYGHNIPASTAAMPEDVAAVVKSQKSESKMVDQETLPRSRSKNKLSTSATTATGLPVSKRARS